AGQQADRQHCTPPRAHGTPPGKGKESPRGAFRGHTSYSSPGPDDLPRNGTHGVRTRAYSARLSGVPLRPTWTMTTWTTPGVPGAGDVRGQLLEPVGPLNMIEPGEDASANEGVHQCPPRNPRNSS